MALRDQPYLPLYVQDYLTDEKLNECSAAAQGVYIKLMCLMHKQTEYGKILLKQKDKQSENQINNFAFKIARNLPFGLDEIKKALGELVQENVLIIDGDFLIQKRMVKDNSISEVRSKAGKKGGNKTQKFAKAKTKANSENEYEYENEVDNVNKNVNFGKYENLLKIEKLQEDFKTETSWKESICRNIREIKKGFSMNDVDDWLETFFKLITSDGEELKTIGDTKKHFNRWLLIEINKQNGNRNNNNPKSDSDLKQSASNAVDKMFGGQQ